MSVFSLVVARKGSKGLVDKNVLKLGAKRVFEFTVEYSLGLGADIGAEVITVVSSDSEVIQAYCAERDILFVDRDAELAADETRIEHVIYDAYGKVGRAVDYISLLYGNMPIRWPNEFVRAYKFLQGNPDYDAAMSMQNAEKYNPAWMLPFSDEIVPERSEESARRQDLKPFMYHDGHTIITRAGYFLSYMEQEQRSMKMWECFGRRIKPMLSNKLMIDIDTERDLLLAGAALKAGLL